MKRDVIKEARRGVKAAITEKHILTMSEIYALCNIAKSEPIKEKGELKGSVYYAVSIAFYFGYAAGLRAGKTKRKNLTAAKD